MADYPIQCDKRSYDAHIARLEAQQGSLREALDEAVKALEKRQDAIDSRLNKHDEDERAMWRANLETASVVKEMASNVISIKAMQERQQQTIDALVARDNAQRGATEAGKNFLQWIGIMALGISGLYALFWKIGPLIVQHWTGR